MAKDIGEYHSQIVQFVAELCRVYYKHSQPEDRRDISSEVALIAHQNREKVTDESETAFLAWIHQIAKNVVRNWSRREGSAARRALGSLDDENFGAGQILSDSRAPETNLLFQEKMAIIRDAILELPFDSSTGDLVFYIEGISR